MEIKEGEYIRTKDGVIAKVEYITNEDGTTVYWFDNIIYTIYCEPIDFLNKDNIDEYITKHSEFIWELIKKGDYVNGHKVEEIWEDGFRFGGCDYMFQVTGYDIKSIVTREMFESIKYEVIE